MQEDCWWCVLNWMFLYTGGLLVVCPELDVPLYRRTVGGVS